MLNRVKTILKTSIYATIAILVVLPMNASTVFGQQALSPKQKALFNKNILYYDPGDCSYPSDQPDVSAGAGEPAGAIFPNLDPNKMADGINKYIEQNSPNSKMINLGATIVAGAKNSNINPFLIVAIAQKESNIADPTLSDNFNVVVAHNAFGRTATLSQPHVQGAHLWYKWSSVKASVNHNAPENVNATGGGDIAAYLRNQYSDKIDTSDLVSLFLEYAPPSENDTNQYIEDVKSWINDMIRLTDSSAGTIDVSSVNESAPNVCCPSGGAVSVGSFVPDDQLPGGTPEEKIWNYLRALGFTPVQAAGAMGNIAIEGVFDPWSVENQPGLPERSKNPDDAGSYGWGLIGFTPGHSVFDVWAKSAKIKDKVNYENVYFISTQLSIVYEYMKNVTGDGGENMLKEYEKEATNPAKAAVAFEGQVENAGVKAHPERIAAAKAAMRKYGNGIAANAAQTGGDCVSGAVPGDLLATVKNYAWPTYHEPPYFDMQPAYRTAVIKAQREGRYVGGGSHPGIDCGGFVTTLMVDSGFEPNYNYSGKGGATTTQEAWLQANWQQLHPSSTKDLQPGDVAINSGHTYVYVGNIKGFGSDVASASYSTTGLSWRTPMAGHETPADPDFNWYRKK